METVTARAADAFGVRRRSFTVSCIVHTGNCRGPPDAFFFAVAAVFVAVAAVFGRVFIAAVAGLVRRWTRPGYVKAVCRADRNCKFRQADVLSVVFQAAGHVAFISARMLLVGQQLIVMRGSMHRACGGALLVADRIDFTGAGAFDVLAWIRFAGERPAGYVGKAVLAEIVPLPADLADAVFHAAAAFGAGCLDLGSGIASRRMAVDRDRSAGYPGVALVQLVAPARMQTGVVLLAEQRHRQQKKQNKRKIRTNVTSVPYFSKIWDFKV